MSSDRILGALIEGEDLPSSTEVLTAALRRHAEDRVEASKLRVRPRKTLMQYAQALPEQRGPLNFKDFAYLRELYSQDAVDGEEWVLKKSSQVGASTAFIRWALYQTDVLQRKIIYTFPTADELRAFSKDRFGPLVKNNEHLAARMAGGTNTVEQKQFGAGGWLYLRGLQVPLDSIDADGIAFDEYDASDQANVEASEHRVTGLMSLGIIRRLGYPLIAGGGIAKLFEDTDQRSWTVKCTACGDWQAIRGIASFERNLDHEALTLVCRSCRRPLDVRTGEWVAKYPDRDKRGYSMSKLLVPERRVLARLVEDSKKKRPDQQEAFYQRGLGEEWAAPDARISQEQVEACVDPSYRMPDSLATNNVVTMGVDVASARALNVTIEEWLDDRKGRKVFIGTVEDIPGGASAYQQLCALMIRYSVWMCGIDVMPEGRWARAFAREFPGRVFTIGMFEPTPDTRNMPPTWNVNRDEAHVSLWRTRGYEAMFERWRLGEVILPPLASFDKDYPSHLGALLRRHHELPDGRKVVRFERTGDEDYAQAELYNLVARQLVRFGEGLRATLEAPPMSLAEQMPGLEDDGFGDAAPGFGPGWYT